MWSIKVKRPVGVEVSIDWVEGELSSSPPQVAEAVGRYLDSRSFVSMTPTGPFEDADMSKGYVAFTATVETLYNLFGINLDDNGVSFDGDFDWPVIPGSEYESDVDY